MKSVAPEILYEDAAIIVVNKPAGMLTIPDRFRASEIHLRGWLEKKYGKIFVVHRLDRDTSGVMVFAKTAEAHRNLSMQFEQHSCTKRYHAVLMGRVEKDDIRVDIPLMPDPANTGMMIASARGKESLTDVHVLERYRVATLVECTLHTGRQHQLRVHCASIGHPLLVDALYGPTDKFFLSGIKRRYNIRKNEEEKPLITRASLHARLLGFAHPETGEYCEYSCEPPKDFTALVSVLRKYSRIPDVLHS